VHNNNSEFTVAFLKDQVSFLQSKISKATLELEEKERIIQQIEREKRDCQRKFETIEFANFEMQEKVTLLQNENSRLIREKEIKELKYNESRNLLITPSAGK
jgi:hypothetical protein